MSISGVYKITNIISGKFYIGSSKDVNVRKTEHWNALNRGDHKNTILQRSWNKYGAENFTFSIIEECDPSVRLIREQHYIDVLQPFKSIGYNINKTANGGDGYTNNPRREEIIEKLRIMNTGDNNGMFGKTHTEDAIKKQKAKSVGRYTIQWFIDKYGETEGTKKYHERRVMLSARKINYVYDNGLKGKKVKVEADRGKKVNAGRAAIKERKVEFDSDIQSDSLSSRQIADKYGVSVATVKYHRRNLIKRTDL